MDREAWIDIQPADTSAGTAPVGGPYDFGFVPAMRKLLVRHPRIGAAFRGLFNEVMFAPGTLSRRERELVAAVAAAGQDCFY